MLTVFDALLDEEKDFFTQLKEAIPRKMGKPVEDQSLRTAVV